MPVVARCGTAAEAVAEIDEGGRLLTPIAPERAPRGPRDDHVARACPGHVRVVRGQHVDDLGARDGASIGQRAGQAVDGDLRVPARAAEELERSRARKHVQDHRECAGAVCEERHQHPPLLGRRDPDDRGGCRRMLDVAIAARRRGIQ